MSDVIRNFLHHPTYRPSEKTYDGKSSPFRLLESPSYIQRKPKQRSLQQMKDAGEIPEIEIEGVDPVIKAPPPPRYTT